MRITENGDIRITEDNNTRIEEFEEITYPSSINRVTVITFPLNEDREDITEGIESGSLYLNKLLFQNQINYGESNSDRFEVTLFDCDDISGETIQVYQLDYAEDENNPVRTNLFYGVVDSCTREDNGVNRKLVAYDLMYDLGNKDATEWWNNFWGTSFNTTVSQLLSSLLSEFGVTLNPNIDVSEIPTSQIEVIHFSRVQAITFGTILAYIGQVLMVNPHFNEEGQLDLIKLGANFNRSIYSIEGGYEDENSHFEDYTTEPVSRVVIYGETELIAGEYGTGDNVYVIKGNPLLYNINGMTYHQLAQIFYENLSGSGISYKPANIKMIVSKTNIKLGDIVKTPHGSSVVSSMELSGSLLVEQTLISVGNQKLTPDDFDLTSSQVGTALEQSTTTAKHFVWVQDDGAYVTTDNVASGQAPTQNYSKLTDTGLYVATSGKEIAHFGIDENNEPVSILGSTEAGSTYTIMNSEGMLAGKQLTQDVSSNYFSINVPDDTSLYSTVDGTLVNSGTDHYLNLDSSDVFIGVSQVSYGRSFSVTGDIILSLSQTRGGYDFIVEEVLDTLFANVPTPEGTYDSIYHIPLREWFNSWFTYTGTSDTTTIRIVQDMGFITFLDDGVGTTHFSAADSVKIQVSVDSHTLYSSEYARRYLDLAHFNFADNRVNITNFKYYTYEPQTYPRTIRTDFGHGSATLEVIRCTLRWYASMLQGEVTYQLTLGKSIETNKGINAVVLGDSNTVTDDSQLNVVVVGNDNVVDNDRISDTELGSYVLGNNNTVEQRSSVVIGMVNKFLGASEENEANTIVGNQNTIENEDPEPYHSSHYNQITGNYNDIIGSCIHNVVVGEYNSITDATACNVFGERLKVDGAIVATVVGRFNKTATYADSSKFIVGCGGSESDRRNSMELTGSQMTVLGDIYFNGGSTGLTTQLTNKQATLVSGTNIKTINGTNILGGGNITTPDTKAGDVTYANPTSDNKINSGVAGGVIVHSFSLSAGLYIVEVGVSFSTNATGYRMFGVTNNSSATDFGGAINRVSTPAHAGYATNLSKTVILQPSTTTTYYIKAYQNSGSNDITVSPRVRYTKLK